MPASGFRVRISGAALIRLEAHPGRLQGTQAGAANAQHSINPLDIVKYPEFRGAVFAPEIPDDFWAELDAEVDARTPAPAQREASRRQGRALLRAARVAWPEATGLAGLAGLATTAGARLTATAGARAEARSGESRPEYRGGPHHAVVLGAAAAAAGCDHREAARIAVYQAVAGPVSAAVRLLALDPMRATAVLARLAGEVDEIAAQGAAYAQGPLGDLPCASAPALDLLAETHIRAEVRLFES